MSDKYRKLNTFLERWAESEARKAEAEAWQLFEHNLAIECGVARPELMFEAEIKTNDYDREFLRAMRVRL